jgi:hypothetical protein
MQRSVPRLKGEETLKVERIQNLYFHAHYFPSNEN